MGQLPQHSGLQGDLSLVTPLVSHARVASFSGAWLYSACRERAVASHTCPLLSTPAKSVLGYTVGTLKWDLDQLRPVPLEKAGSQGV